MTDYTLLNTGLYQRNLDGVLIPPSSPGNTDWEALQTWLKAGNKPAEEGNKLDYLKDQKHLQNEAEATRHFQALVDGYPQEERESWWLLAKDVDAFLEDMDLTKHPCLRMEAIVRSNATDEEAIQDSALALAETVIRKRDALQLATATIRGVRSRIANQIDDIKTVPELQRLKVPSLWSTLLESAG